ncbi:hypothetical protein Micbo1qcDRAFT_173542 [Microdochium bolleyi]|uniref:LIM zinc-binding domain-containing protein n=1 Tax=Microdochium bolleyi TaxID=196109 RepID=A0A136JC82_9PEZI|nr:hypothetical protein Micbo1qcDRAFT_173542 [Microdochium bolleyi]
MPSPAPKTEQQHDDIFTCTFCWHLSQGPPHVLGGVCGEICCRADEVVSLGWCFWHRSCYGCLFYGNKKVITGPSVAEVFDYDGVKTETEQGERMREGKDGTIKGREITVIPMCANCLVDCDGDGVEHPHVLQKALRRVDRADGGLSRLRWERREEDRQRESVANQADLVSPSSERIFTRNGVANGISPQSPAWQQHSLSPETRPRSILDEHFSRKGQPPFAASYDQMDTPFVSCPTSPEQFHLVPSRRASPMLSLDADSPSQQWEDHSSLIMSPKGPSFVKTEPLLSPPESREYLESYPIQEGPTRIPTRLRSIFSEQTLKREADQRERLRRSVFGEKHRLRRPNPAVNRVWQLNTPDRHVREAHVRQEKSLQEILDHTRDDGPAQYTSSSGIAFTAALDAYEHSRLEGTPSVSALARSGARSGPVARLSQQALQRDELRRN